VAYGRPDAIAFGLNHDRLEQPISPDGFGQLLDGGFVEVPQSDAAVLNPVQRNMETF